MTPDYALPVAIFGCIVYIALLWAAVWACRPQPLKMEPRPHPLVLSAPTEQFIDAEFTEVKQKTKRARKRQVHKTEEGVLTNVSTET